MLRSFIRILVGVLAGLLALLGVVYCKQHALVYHPRPYDSSYAGAMPRGGSEIPYGAPFGKQVAFYAPPARGGMPRRLWLAFCGNGSLALDWTTILAGNPNRTDGFLLIDYPGYGRCEGYATIASMRASTEEALHQLAERLGIPEAELEPRLCAIGHSLGAAVALDFAARHPVQRVVAVAPFTTLREEAAQVTTRWLAWLLVESYDNRENLKELLRRNPAARVAIFHGTDDALIPLRMGKELSEIAPARIDFCAVKGGDHVTVLTLARERMIEWMNR